MSEPQTPHAQSPKLSREHYQAKLKAVFTLIQKTVPSRKNKELIEVCKVAIEQVDKDTECKADKYFYILKMALETGLPRLMNEILTVVQQLYAYECLVGDCADNCVYPADKKPQQKNGRLPRKLIDAIAESVMECAQDTDNTVQLQVVQILTTLVADVRSRVHEQTLLQALRTQYSIYMTATSQTNAKTAKACSVQMINAVFNRLDTYQRFGTNAANIDMRRIENRASDTKLDKTLTKKNDEAKEEKKQEVAFQPLDLYIHSVVRNMVDSVQLYEARLAEIKTQPPSEQQSARSDDSKNRSVVSEQTSVSLNPITSGSSAFSTVKVQNELGFDSGAYGWCICCRKGADQYCEDTMHPVCSEPCRQQHKHEVYALEKETQPNRASKPDQPIFTRAKDYDLTFTDAYLVFRSTVKLAIGDAASNQPNQFFIKTKLIGLEIFQTVLANPKQALTQRQEFIDVIKNQLCDGLLKHVVNVANTETQIFPLVIDIFYSLFMHFRQHLKQVIRVFIETIFLKLLDSTNSTFQLKNQILGVFDKISKQTTMLLEIFVNYDCDMQQKDLTGRIIESLCKIANFKVKTNDSNSGDAIQLRNFATKILVQILRSFNGTIDAKIAESKIIQRITQANQTLTATEDQVEQSDSGVSIPGRSSLGDDIQNKRNQKQILAQAAKKFNFKPKAGIAFLVQQKWISPPDQYEQHIIDIVKFLKTTPPLDKTMIGVFLGTDDKVPKDCLYRFIDEFDLKNVAYVTSLKTILQGFRLPGEGQVVDRVMEKFGMKFTEDNPEGTDGCQGPMTAEAVYLLSYATMMMQTSLHNPNAVKSKMTLEDFSKMIKGINGGQNLSEMFVKKIYETVERDPFTLNEDDDARIKQESANAHSEKRKKELLDKEAQNIVLRGQNEMNNRGNNSVYIRVENADPIRPMFENIWSANLAVFGMILEESTDEAIQSLCVEGFVLSIKICGFFNMKTERNAFVSSFAQYTMVTPDRKIKQKHINCILSLLELATYQGNYLGESWFFVLQCISKLDEMINFEPGQALDRDFFDDAPKQNKKDSNRQLKEQNHQANCDLIAQQVSQEMLDTIFQNSLLLDQEAIIHFIQALCSASKQELRDQLNPRKFSLQRLVETADLNMSRIRFVWQKLWENLQEHFVWVGAHQNIMVAIFAIDSLRQLADKFLKISDFQSFNFQKDFLSPFEQIMLQNMHTRSEIKDYIVCCIVSICATKTAFIKSGWSVIINIFTLAAQDSEKDLVEKSFDALKKAIQANFPLIKGSFNEVVNCLNKYSQNSRFEKEAKMAQELMLELATKLQDKANIDFFIQTQGQALFKENLQNMQRYPPQYGLAANQEKEKKIAGSVIPDNCDKPSEAQIRLAVLKGVWFPLLQNVSNLVIEKNPQKQQNAMNSLFDILEKATHNKNTLFWREVFSQVLYPVLEDIQLAVENLTQQQDSNFYQQTLEVIVTRFNSFLNEYYDRLPNVISVYIDIICLFVANIRNSKLAQVVATSLANLVQTVGSKLQPQEWDCFTSSLCLCFEVTLPAQLMHPSDDLNLDHHFTQCLVQLQLINCVKDTVNKHYKQFTEGNILQLLAALELSHGFAKRFNENVEIRKNLWARGFMKDMKTLPGLIKQQYLSLATVIQIRFQKLYADDGSESDDDLIQLCKEVLSDYELKIREISQLKKSNMTRQNQPQSEDHHIAELEKQVQSLTPIISTQILGNLQNLPDATLKKRVKEICPLSIEITLSPDPEVRQNNKVLLQRMFKMLM